MGYFNNHPDTAARKTFVSNSIEQGLGISDYSDEEVSNIANDPASALYRYADMLSRRSQSGWSTHGHSAADVNIYASDPKAARPLVGNHENTEVGDFLREYLGVDVDAVTKELKKKDKELKMLGEGKGGDWMGKVPEEGERLDGQTHLASYSGDYKRGVEHGDACGCGH
jgi:alkaline phosphatase